MSELCIENMSQEIKAMLYPHLHDYFDLFFAENYKLRRQPPPLVSKAWHWHRHHLPSWAAGKEAHSNTEFAISRKSHIGTASMIACSHVYGFSWASWQRDTDKWLQQCSLSKCKVETQPKCYWSQQHCKVSHLLNCCFNDLFWPILCIALYDVLWQIIDE